MINPLRSEEDAFRFTLIVVALLAPIVLVAIIWSTGAALARRRRPRARARRRPVRPQARRAAREGCCCGQRRATTTARYRILVVANETLSGRALRAEISERGRSGDGTELRVVCPALNSKIKHWTNEEDAARAAGAAAPPASAGRPAQRGLRRRRRHRRRRPRAGDGGCAAAVPRRRGDHLDAPARPLQLAGARRRGARPERFDIPVTHVVVDLDREGVGPGAGYLTVRVPFIPACSWPGTQQ